MCYQIAKEIGMEATVLEGKVDEIILTGGLAYDKRLVKIVKKRVEFIAPVVVYAGEKRNGVFGVRCVKSVKKRRKTKNIFSRSDLMFENMKDLVSKAVEGDSKTLVVACADDKHVLEAVEMARSKGIIRPILIGNKEIILMLLEDLKN